MGRKLDSAILEWKRMLASGCLGSGLRLPSVRETTCNLSVSHATAAKVYARLIREGLVKSVPGKGMFLRGSHARHGKVAFPFRFSESNWHLDSIIRAVSRAITNTFAEERIAYDVYMADECPSECARYDGILLSAEDVKSVHAVRKNFRGKLVIMEGGHIPLPDLDYCQFRLDFLPALDEFNEVFQPQRYQKILLVGTEGRRSGNVKALFDVLGARYGLTGKLESILLVASNFTASYTACTYFRAKAEKYAKYAGRLLVIAMSEFYAPGIRQVFEETGIRADILSFENREYYDDPDKKAYFTSIDSNIVRLAQEAAKTLCDLVNGKEDRKLIVKIPSRLIIRDSIAMPEQRRI